MRLTRLPVRFAADLQREVRSHLRVSTRSRGGGGPLVALALVAASALLLAVARLLQVSTAAAWLYLPLVLFVTLRWGGARGLILALAANLLVLTFVVPPLGRPVARDLHVYVRLAISLLGMVVAIATLADLNRHRLASERQERGEAESLAEIGRRISASLDLDQVLQTVVDAACRLVAADIAQIALAEEDGSLRVIAHTGNHVQPSAELRLAPGKGVGGRVLQTRQPLQVPIYHAATAIDHYADLDALATAEGVQSVVALPVLRQDKTEGVFWVFSRRRRRFSREEILRLERLAVQAAAGIANARAHWEEQTMRNEVEALLAATAKLGEQAEPEAVLRTLVEEAARLLETERAVYAILIDGRLVVPMEFRGGRWRPDGHEARRQGILWSVWEYGRPYRTTDIRADPNANPASVQAHGSRTQLTLPLRSPTGENLGLISLNNKRGVEGFSARDERLLAAICETGAAILLRAKETVGRQEADRAVARSRQEVEALLAAADRLNSAIEHEEVLLRVASTAVELLDVRFASIITNEGDHALSRYRWFDGVWHSTARRLPLDASASGWVITHGQPIRIDRLEDGLRRGPLPLGGYVERAGPAPGEGVGVGRFSLLSVPIIAGTGRVLGALHLYDRRDGQAFTAGDQRLAEGIAHHAAVAMERASLIQDLREREDRLRQQAVTDPLTGLPNRTRFLEQLAQTLATWPGHSPGIAVLFLDLDGFKIVNDSLGHATGDELLRAVGFRLRALSRKRESVARFGGDEFAVLVTDVQTEAEATAFADRLVTELRTPLAFGTKRRLSVSASVGVAYQGAAESVRSAEELLREADIALYRAKAAGRGRAMAFVPSMSVEVAERMELQAELERALEQGDLRMRYQPLIDLETKRIIGAEALLRWQHPHRGLLTPPAFIALAEEAALIVPIGRWALQEACKQATVWCAVLPAEAPFRMSVNLSAVQLAQHDLVEQVAGTLRQAHLNPDVLQLEITETAIVAQEAATIAKLAALRDLGVHLAIDDFGTGYSSLSYLQRLPVDMVKLDQSFMHGLGQGSSSAAIVRAVITLAHALGMTVTAEGIETIDQAAFLTALGCDHGQGFYFAEPRAATELDSCFREPERLCASLRIARPLMNPGAAAY